jgi:hypothetical protein
MALVSYETSLTALIGHALDIKRNYWHMSHPSPLCSNCVRVIAIKIICMYIPMAMYWLHLTRRTSPLQCLLVWQQKMLDCYNIYACYAIIDLMPQGGGVEIKENQIKKWYYSNVAIRPSPTVHWHESNDRRPIIVSIADSHCCTLHGWFSTVHDV